MQSKCQSKLVWVHQNGCFFQKHWTVTGHFHSNPRESERREESSLSAVCGDADLGRGRVTLVADPGISRLLGGLLEWRLQAAEVIAEPALITPERQTDRQTDDHALVLTNKEPTSSASE